MLQAQVRGLRARKEWRRKRDAVVLLQAHTRGVLARRAVKKMKRDVRMVLSSFRYFNYLFMNLVLCAKLPIALKTRFLS